MEILYICTSIPSLSYSVKTAVNSVILLFVIITVFFVCNLSLFVQLSSFDLFSLTVISQVFPYYRWFSFLFVLFVLSLSWPLIIVLWHRIALDCRHGADDDDDDNKSWFEKETVKHTTVCHACHYEVSHFTYFAYFS